MLVFAFKKKALTLSEGCYGKFTCIFLVRVRISRCVAIERGREKKREKGRVRKKKREAERKGVSETPPL